MSADTTPESSSMGVAVVTLFPELFSTFLRTSFVKRAITETRLRVHLEYLREHGLGRHRSVDDTPYGGGAGMLMRVDCIVDAMVNAERQCGFVPKAHRILMCPQGKRFDQRAARRIATYPNVVLVCGRYEGFDERVRQFVDEELSLGDFVLTGGEIPAMAVIEACIRMLPGVLGNEASAIDESFSTERDGQLEYPQFTRPVQYEGLVVPEVLRSGDHRRIEQWRREQSRLRTEDRRPDLVCGQPSPPIEGEA
ncbi:MAG TPA: tRNA (guanosine(37)-N1)-methyltransferase TrmD [Polyangiaceae bacterium]